MGNIGTDCLRFSLEAGSPPVAAIAPALEILATSPDGASCRPLLDLWATIWRASGLPENGSMAEVAGTLERHWTASGQAVSDGDPPVLTYSDSISPESLPQRSVRLAMDVRPFADAPRAVSMQLVVPPTTDWADLAGVASELACRSSACFRWIVAGFRFVGLPPAAHGFPQSLRVIRGRAKRFYGPDLEDPVGRFTMLGWFQLRSVNWLAILSSGLVGEASHVQEGEFEGLRIRRLESSLMFQAGDQPTLADVNRQEDSPAYRRMDVMFRRIRAGVGMSWYEPWTVGEFRNWLERWNPNWIGLE